MSATTDTGLQRFTRSAFSPETLQLIESWWRTPVVTDRSAFDRIPSKNESIKYREPGVETLESLALPPLPGSSLPSWMRGKDGSLAVVKPCLVTDVLEGEKFLIGASEAIASTLARHVGVLVAPVQVWKLGRDERPEDYYIASLRILSDARAKPPEPVLANNLVTLARLGSFDTWINNPDRSLENIIYGSAWQNSTQASAPPQTVIAGIDHGFRQNDPKKTYPILRHDLQGSKFVSATLWQQVRAEITASPKVKSVITAIQSTPDAVISDAVTTLPDALFPQPAGEAKAKRVDALKYRRDHIEALTMTAAGLA